MNGSKANVERYNLRGNNSLDISKPRKHNLKFRPYKILYFFAIKDHFLIITRLHCSHSRSATCSGIFQEAMMKIAAVAVTARQRADQPADGETLCSESDSDEEDSDTSLSGFFFYYHRYPVFTLFLPQNIRFLTQKLS